MTWYQRHLLLVPDEMIRVSVCELPSSGTATVWDSGS